MLGPGRGGRRRADIGADARQWGVAGQFSLDELAPDHLLRIQGREATHQVFEFADVAGPAMPLHPFLRSDVEVLERKSLGSRLHEEVPGEVRNVLGPFPQGGKAQRNHVQAEEQVLAEQTLLD